MLNYKDNPEEIPPSLLENYTSPTLILKSDLRKYYPDMTWVDKMSLKELQIEVASARGTIMVLEQKISNLQKKLSLNPFYHLYKGVKKLIKKG